MTTELYVEEEITFKELANRLGISDLDNPEIYDILEEGYEILSFDHDTKQSVWKPLETFVVKSNAKEHYQLNTLHGTADHKLWFEDKYIKLSEHPGAELVKTPIQVVDCQVSDTHNYLAEGQINHNTTTPGGNAIPYHASLRIKISGGSKIEKDINGKTIPIGITVNAKTIKNKVARPWREVTFDIIFGHGIEDGEHLFDSLRIHCEKTSSPTTLNGKKVSIEGTGAWKSFIVSDVETGEVVIEKKFQKSNFERDILSNPQYVPYMKALMDDCFVLTIDKTNHTVSGVDTENAAEVEAAAQQ